MSGRDDFADDELAEELAALLGAAAPLLEPDARGRDRLLARVEGVERFLPFLDRLVMLFDLPESQAAAHLRSIEHSTQWSELVPGIRYLDFDVGPAHPTCHGGLIRIEPGSIFPPHQHIGEERVLVLQGEAMDDRGRRYRPGDWLVRADGSVHALTSTGGVPLIFAALVIAMQFGVGD